MNIEWFKSCKSTEEKEKIKALLLGSILPFSKLEKIINDRIETIDREECSSHDFEDPNWAYKQAYRNGRKTELKTILELIKF